jgi:putative ABC transport system permease protein
MKLWHYSAREIRSRPARATLTLLSIVLGVAAVVSVGVATAATRRAYRQMYTAMTGRAALEVTSVGRGGFDDSVIEQLEQVPGVTAVVPVLQRRTVLYLPEEQVVEGGDNRVKLQALGIDPARDSAIREYEVVEGEFFVKGGGILLEKGFANSIGVGLRDDVRFLTQKGVQEATVVGLLAPKGAAALTQGGAMFLPLRAAQAVFSAKGRVDTIHLVLDEKADIDSVERGIAAMLPPGLSVRRPAARSQLAEETLLTSEEGLRLATSLSLVVSVFIILNTYLMNVGERRRQLSILRAIGATKGQVMRLLLAEGLLMGAVGTVIGMLVGLAGAIYLSKVMAGLFQVNMPELELSYGPFALGALFGLGISMLGTYLPARKAGRISPLEGMSTVALEDRESPPVKLAILGSVVVVGALAVLAACIYGYLPFWLEIATAIIAMVGVVLLVPATIGPLSKLVSRVLSPLLGMEGVLAQRQILRRRTRTALTVGVLFVAIATGIGMGNAVIDNINDVQDWYRRTIVGDYFVRAMIPDMSTGAAADLPDGIGDKIRAIPGIKSLETVRFVKTEASGHDVIVIVREFVDDDRVNLDLVDGEEQQVRQRLHDGQVVIGTVLAQRADLKLGDEFAMDTPHGSRTVRIGGITNDYMMGGLVIYMQRGTARKLLDVEGYDGYVIKAQSGSLDSVGAALTRLTKDQGLLLQTFADVSRMIDGIMAGVVGCLWVLLALGFVVAAFGIVNTLTMNVLEQTRELGLLRIVAMTRGQVRRMIMAQAAIMGIVGLGPGIAAGVAMAWIINAAAAPALGHPIDLTLHPWLLGGSFVVAMLIVMGAAWIPARRASRLELVRALQYE